MANGYFDHLSDSIAVLKITVQLLLDFLQPPSRIVHYADIFSRNNRPTPFSLPRRFLPSICFCYTTISRLFSARLYPLSNFFSLPIFFDSTNFLSISIILFHSNLTPISIVVFSSFCWLFPNYYIFLFYRLFPLRHHTSLSFFFFFSPNYHSPFPPLFSSLFLLNRSSLFFYFSIVSFSFFSVIQPLSVFCTANPYTLAYFLDYFRRIIPFRFFIFCFLG